MTPEQITDQLSQIVRVGMVTARDPGTMRLQVQCPDTVSGALVTEWLQTLTPRAKEDAQYDLPDVGDQVLCLFLPNGLEQGFVLGCMFAPATTGTPPVSSGDKWHRKFKDGTTVEYDRAEGKLAADIKGGGILEVTAQGPVSVKAQGPVSVESPDSITLKAPGIVLKGNLTQTNVDGGPASSTLSGTFKVRQGDVIAESISLVGHTHEGVESGPDKTGAPVGGA